MTEVIVQGQKWWWKVDGETLTLQSIKPGRKNRFTISTRVTADPMTSPEVENAILMYMAEDQVKCGLS